MLESVSSKGSAMWGGGTCGSELGVESECSGGGAKPSELLIQSLSWGLSASETLYKSISRL